MSTFENPLNGYRESVTFVGAFVLTLLCGPFYFLYRNVWNHAAISFAIILLAAILPVMILSAAGAVLAALMLVVEWLAYAFFHTPSSGRAICNADGSKSNAFESVNAAIEG